MLDKPVPLTVLICRHFDLTVDPCMVHNVLHSPSNFELIQFSGTTKQYKVRRNSLLHQEVASSLKVS